MRQLTKAVLAWTFLVFVTVNVAGVSAVNQTDQELYREVREMNQLLKAMSFGLMVIVACNVIQALNILFSPGRK